MSTPLTRLEAYVNNNGIGEYPSLVLDIAGVIAQYRILQEQVTTARERALDEVSDALYDEMGHDWLDAICAAIAKLRATPADPELARLEREVARAAVAHSHALVEHRRTRNKAYCATTLASTAANGALQNYLHTKSKGDAK